MRFRPGRRTARATVVIGAGTALVLGAAYAPASFDVPGASTGGQTPDEAGPSQVALDAAALVCPGPEQRGLADSAVPEVAQDVTVEALTATNQALPEALTDTEDDEAEMDLERLSGKGLGRTEDPGSVVTTEVSDADGVVLAASGSLAPGLSGAQLYLGAVEQQLALSVTPCSEPARESWLVAGGDAVGRTERIVLANPGSGPVDVRLDVLGAQGSSTNVDTDVETEAGAVVALGPGDREVLLVDALAPGAASPVVRVTSSPGPVSAFLGDRWLEGSTDSGMQLTAPVAPPATEQVLGSFRGASAADGTTVTVRAANPGTGAAVVQVRALTADGAVRVEADVAVVEGRSTQDITLRGLPRDDYALQVSSDRPVVAAAQTQTPEGPRGVRDVAWSPALPALAALGGTPLPQPSGESAVGYRLDVSSPDGGAAEVLVQDADGAVDSTSVDLAAGHSLSRDLEDAVAVWVVPDAGEMYASVAAQASVLPRPAQDDVSARGSSGAPKGRAEHASLRSVMAVPDLALTRPVLHLAPELP